MNAPNFKVSVAMCSFNGESYIHQQIESILNQSRMPDEIIICDDGSTDKTIDIVCSIIEKKLSVIKFFKNEKHLGFVKNFEKAIAQATGDIIFLSDQDDIWFTSKIATIVPFFEDNKVVLVYSDAILLGKNIKSDRQTLFSTRKRFKINTKRSACQLIQGVGINGCTMAFRANLKELVLPIPSNWGHDHWISFIAHAVGNVVPLSEPLIFYRRHENSAGNDPRLEGGLIKEWETGIKSSLIEDYRRDRHRWEAMLQRLIKIKKGNLSFINYPLLDEYIHECRRRLEFARLREKIKQKPRLGRFYLSTKSLLNQNYHRYLHGMKSYFKDLLIS